MLILKFVCFLPGCETKEAQIQCLDHDPSYRAQGEESTDAISATKRRLKGYGKVEKVEG